MPKIAHLVIDMQPQFRTSGEILNELLAYLQSHSKERIIFLKYSGFGPMWKGVEELARKRVVLEKNSADGSGACAKHLVGYQRIILHGVSKNCCVVATKQGLKDRLPKLQSTGVLLEYGITR